MEIAPMHDAHPNKKPALLGRLWGDQLGHNGVLGLRLHAHTNLMHAKSCAYSMNPQPVGHEV